MDICPASHPPSLALFCSPLTVALLQLALATGGQAHSCHSLACVARQCIESQLKATQSTLIASDRRRSHSTSARLCPRANLLALALSHPSATTGT